MRWYPQFTTGQLRYYRTIPKIDLHRHLEGSLRLNTLMEIAKEEGISLPFSEFPGRVQIQKNDPLNFNTFLSKFQHLRQFYRSPEIIARITQEAITDAADDNVRYLELRFTPVALARVQGFTQAEVMDWVIDSANQAALQSNLQLKFIISINRHEPLELAEETVRHAVERMARGVVGLDLAGNEADFPAQPFASLFQQARQSGLHITVHAAEWGGPDNVRQAIEEMGAERIGHGVRILEDPRIVAMAREHGTVLEVCITSNYQSGVVPALSAHPLARLLNAGLNVTINTDDPGVSGITLSDEYRLVLEDLGLPPSVLVECILSGARHAFLPPQERQSLEDRLAPLLSNIFEL